MNFKYRGTVYGQTRAIRLWVRLGCRTNDMTWDRRALANHPTHWSKIDDLCEIVKMHNFPADFFLLFIFLYQSDFTQYSGQIQM